ncbi:HXXEE domain-containing protein [Domibacillus sp. PGB-M46]|uniref:HXXEE domain-containing protein n=1 Tax=Domibacillus sp. PGB-M46 TaxID=2910255 RepID=UPI001F59181F|nr:HXXEE domain-containing protein [Domibacillus sp. PGB-M46]MCI2252855.1 HXXEE domain-containing protein [Domibacillus sp. PGB-M46]
MAPIKQQAGWHLCKWGPPVLFLVHNIEESFGMISFLRNRFSIEAVTQRQFTAAVVFLTILVFFLVVTFRKSKAFLLFVYGTIFFNAAQHIVLLAVFRAYNPGAASACVILVIFLLFIRQVRPFLERKLMRFVLLGSLLTYPSTTWAALWIGGVISRISSY